MLWCCKKSFDKKLAFLTQNKAKLCKNLILTLVLEKTPIISPKITDNFDLNIDPGDKFWHNFFRQRPICSAGYRQISLHQKITLWQKKFVHAKLKFCIARQNAAKVRINPNCVARCRTTRHVAKFAFRVNGPWAEFGFHPRPERSEGEKAARCCVEADWQWCTKRTFVASYLSLLRRFLTTWLLQGCQTVLFSNQKIPIWVNYGGP
jgi:hypothetical protein